ncbi:efflux RND transporter permease subunit [Gilvimarinus agarilyticus]|uniref:efflux RND transporter permease subunit n=1 Tax=Gilvimarinus sp. 2_MG-2023 TaxID=3062666 RepID=UPI001C09A630|nr:efflux RND transporter permease subunit [Gilvimarinus sp. 2_MG-2023]MBU2887177.1 efflux RND transporter permease subunit [Gilvimarinus agarilyticus]MDO6571836.1 efflux RND transporter permease subunit [Gilvimarinus sp. 2_MG-2023]
MISWFAKNDVAANLLMITIALLGLYSMSNVINLEFFPEFESRRITVDVTLRGATPEDAELGLATRIEESIKDLSGIEDYSSESSEGGTSVRINVEEGYDPRELLDDVKGRVDAINTFPADAERPVITLSRRQRAAITLTIAGDVSELEMRELVEQLELDVLQLPTVTQASIVGVRDYEIAVELEQDRLREFGLTIDQVAEAIAQSSLDLSGGNVAASGGDVLIRSKGQAYRKNEYERIVIRGLPDGTLLRLGDIATVSDGFEEEAVRTRFNGRVAAILDVYSVGDQSVIKVADEVKDYVHKRQATLNDNIELTYWNDKSTVIKKRINTLTKNAIQGGILVILLLSLFLRPSVAIWVFLGIPISFCGAWLMMPLLGVSFNMITLFAFIIVLGIVVDDAIVTGENVYTHLQTSESGLSAAINGTKEVAVPVTFGVITTVVAFIPLMFLGGNRGNIFAQIPLIVVPVLLFSLVESKLVLPAHLKHIRVGKGENSSKLQRWQRDFANGFERAILKFYQSLLERCLHNKLITSLCFFGALAIIIAAINTGHTRFTFFPRIPSETVSLDITMPTGTPFEVTDSHMQRVQQAAQDLQTKYTDESSGESIISDILVRTGGFGGVSHLGRARFELAPAESRSINVSSLELAKEWREQIGPIPGAENLAFRAEFGRSGDPIDIVLRSDNLEALQAISAEIQEKLATYDGVFDISDSLSQGKEELRIDLKPEAHLMGVTRSDVIGQVRQAFFGVEAERIQRGRNDVRVMVRFPRSERNSTAYLNNMLISNGQGVAVPLSQIATLTPDSSPTEIKREDGFRVVNVVADVEKNRVNMSALVNDLTLFVDDVIARYPGVSYSLSGEQEEQAESMLNFYYGLGAVLFVIYCLLAIPFKSYVQPFIVLLIIPFGVIGAMVGHWVMGMTLTIMSLLGMLALMGVLVNDSLVLVDYINKKSAEGRSVMDALLTAGAARFRPVMLTSLTTFFGLMPLLFEKETQAQFLIPMAISLGFGIIFTTFVTLLMVPVNYLIFHNLSQWFAKLRTGSSA